MSLQLAPPCLPHLSLTLGALGRMNLHFSPPCLPIWVPWAACVYTCLPLVSHTCLSLTPSFTPNNFTHAILSHTQSPQVCHAWQNLTSTFVLRHPPSSTFVLRGLTSTVVLRGRRGTISHPPLFRVAGVALMALGGALGLGLVARDARDAAALCVAGVAQTRIHLRFAWQAWHNLTSTFVSRGRRGTHGTGCRAWTWFNRP